MQNARNYFMSGKTFVSTFMCWILFAVEEQQPLWPGGSQAAAHLRPIRRKSSLDPASPPTQLLRLPNVYMCIHRQNHPWLKIRSQTISTRNPNLGHISAERGYADQISTAMRHMSEKQNYCFPLFSEYLTFLDIQTGSTSIFVCLEASWSAKRGWDNHQLALEMHCTFHDIQRKLMHGLPRCIVLCTALSVAESLGRRSVFGPRRTLNQHGHMR